MPGRASLRAGQYYAHPQNRFWPIVADVLGFDAEASYDERVAALRRGGVAVWDVMQSCAREGSLDADILESSIVPNDFESFLGGHPRLRAIFFNGAKAEQSFERYVVPAVAVAASLARSRLPSTSPAHAAMSPGEKLSRWRRALDEALG